MTRTHSTRSSEYALKGINRLYALCGIFALTACAGETITVNAPPPPQDWLTCQAMPERPDLAPLVPFRLSDGRMVYLVEDVNARDSHIARYIVEARGAWFDCSTNLQKVRDYVSETAE